MEDGWRQSDNWLIGARSDLCRQRLRTKEFRMKMILQLCALGLLFALGESVIGRIPLAFLMVFTLEDGNLE